MCSVRNHGIDQRRGFASLYFCDSCMQVQLFSSAETPISALRPDNYFGSNTGYVRMTRLSEPPPRHAALLQYYNTSGFPQRWTADLLRHFKEHAEAHERRCRRGHLCRRGKGLRVPALLAHLKTRWERLLSEWRPSLSLFFCVFEQILATPTSTLGTLYMVPFFFLATSSCLVVGTLALPSAVFVPVSGPTQEVNPDPVAFSHTIVPPYACCSTPCR